ncbi:MAG TPA: IS4 family transposase [Adhaeribacter sp.]|nr:IS4 family transposase [Adhaeribacter sp.]
MTGAGLFRGVFSDKRLDYRCTFVLEDIVNRQSCVLHKSMPDPAALAASYRFMNNDQVSHEQIATRVCSNWLQPGAAIINLQDSSEANFGWHSGSFSVQDAHLGPVGNNKDAGFFMHPSLCLNLEDGFPLGFSDIHLYNRKWGQADKNERAYKQLPLEEKESYRWISQGLASRERLALASYVLYISDRESDIFELFEQLDTDKSDFLVRLRHDRLLHPSEEVRKISEKLGKCSSQPLLLPLNKSGQRGKRQAVLEVKYCSMQVASPKNESSRAYKRVYVIEAIEKADSVPAGEQPIYWRLVTSRKVETLEQAGECLHYYSLRWRIEELFGLVKSQGLDLEASQLQSGKALKTLAVLALQAALQIMQLKEGREREDKPATIAFTQEEVDFIEIVGPTLEGKTQKQQNPYPLRSLAYASWVIARLGGWKGLLSQGKPGIKTFAWGMKAFNQQFQGYSLALKMTRNKTKKDV